MVQHRWLASFVMASLLFGGGESASAARVRYHYVVADPCGKTVLQPAGNGAPGERVCYFGKGGEWYACAPRPNTLATFCHLYTGAKVIVPLDLPIGTPRIEHVWRRIVYNYGSYTVEVRFVPDGSVDVIYNSGPCRELPLAVSTPPAAPYPFPPAPVVVNH